ncbi:MAG: hypothetical protein KDD45_06385 [Bdellovibrionales bacterium]|nr:hypothetical protein [Bdellovibrionales bacterium]
MSKLNTMLALVCVITLTTFSSLAQRVAGGTPKPWGAFGYENIRSIYKDEKIQTILAKSFGSNEIQLEKLMLKNIDDNGFHYHLETSSAGSQQCDFDVTIWNSHETLVNEVVVTDIKISSGCKSNHEGQLVVLKDLEALMTADQFIKMLNLNFSVEEIKYKNISGQYKLYTVDANTINREGQCHIEVLVKDGVVIGVKNQNGEDTCEIVEKTKPISVLNKYEEIFKQFPKGGLSESASYEEYLNVSRNLSPELRKEIRNYMKRSEPKFYKVLTENKKQMKDFFAKFTSENPPKVGNALWILYKIMGVPTDSQGIYIPAIIALEFAPFFVID